MSSFNSLPVEIIAQILRMTNSFAQLRATMLVCKRLYSVSLRHQRSIAWHVGQADIIGFSDALIAVRATEITRRALEQGRLPPDPFPVSTLSGNARKPSLDELQKVRKLEALASWHEDSIRIHTEDNMPDKSECMRHEWARRKWEVWRENHRRALYRYLAAGAILYREYHYPLLAADRPRDFLSTFSRIMDLQNEPYNDSEDSEDSDDNNDADDADLSAYDWSPTPLQRFSTPVHDWFSADDRALLSKLPQFNAYDARHAHVFEPLGQLFLEESGRMPKFECSKHMDIPNHKTSCASLYRFFANQDCSDPELRPPAEDCRNQLSLPPAHAENLFHQILHFLWMIAVDPLGDVLLHNGLPRPPREVRESDAFYVVPFGQFNLYRIVPCHARGHEFMYATSGVTSHAATADKDTSNSNLEQFNMAPLLDRAWESVGIPNAYCGNYHPPYCKYHAAEYLLRKYFGLRFADTAMAFWDPLWPPWDDFVRYGGVFTSREPYNRFHLGRDLFQLADDPVPPLVFMDYNHWE
ncbi:hypothetical protein BJY04DRAFT_217948 [Aspergillus karnatakaensis]|uniref:uncharacterized protein n=1 Tax=Aspergillus karnatakaensis TaxID=1810916 RepID=UPI003CCD4B15